MRIGFDAKRAFYNRSGLGNYSRDTISGLVRYFPENEYYLYTPRKKNPVDYSLEGKVQIVKPEGVHRLYQSYWRSVSLGDRIYRDKLDLYHGLSNELPANIVHTGTRRVVTIHDLIFMRYPELYKSVDREIYQQKFFEASLAADKIIAISQQTKEDIISFFHIPEEKIEVVYQGCSPIFTNKYTSQEIADIKTKYQLPSDFVLSVGTIEKRKNALQILDGINKEKLDIVTVFIGKSTAYVKELQQYIKTHKMEKQVIFLHNVPNDDLPTLYQAASIFIYPSLFEGFGIPILEALNSGTPVITNKYGCFKEAGGDAAKYINPNKPEEIGHAIREIMGNTELMSEMREKGFQHVKEFTADKIANRLMSLYKSLI